MFRSEKLIVRFEVYMKIMRNFIIKYLAHLGYTSELIL